MGSANGEDAIDASGKAASPDRIILVVCPTHRDYRELPRLSPPGIEYIFHDYASTSLEDLVSNPDRAKDLAADPLDEIEAILAKVRRTRDRRRDHIRRLSRLGARRRRRAKARPSRHPIPPSPCSASTNIWRGWSKRSMCRTPFRRLP